MRGYHRLNITSIILSSMFMMSTAQTVTGQNGCYTPWDTRVTLTGRSNGQVGLAVAHNKLVVAWGDRNTNQLKAAVFNGTTWTYPTLPSFPLVMSRWALSSDQKKLISGGGVTMTSSTACNSAYVAYVQAGGQIIRGVRYDGTSWTGGEIYHIPWYAPQSLGPPTFDPSPPSPYYFWTAPPALFGDNSDPPPGYSTALPIGFAFPLYGGWTTQLTKPGQGSQYNTYVYFVRPGQFDCNLGTIQVGSYTACLFWDPDTLTCLDGTGASGYEFDEGFKDGAQQLLGPWSPLWTGAAGPDGEMVELKALAQGNALGNLNPPIWYAFGHPHWYSQNGDTLNCLGANCAAPYYAGQWTNNGIGGAVNPADGTAWFTYSCRYFWSDTCGGSSIYKPFTFMHVGTDGHQSYCTMSAGSGEVTASMPAMTFWKGKLWLAWQSTSDNVVVASIAPWDMGWNGLQPLVRHSFSFSSGQGALKWSSYVIGPYQCSQNATFTEWMDGALGGFTYVDVSGNNYPLGHVNGAAYISSPCFSPPNGPQPPGGIDLGPTGPNGDLMIHFTPDYGGTGHATIN